ncbi:hypothetical protein BOTCAL_0005g00640 [Botryotinia calthae]|uniref:Mid2 domain-containing protein n=1 Tax=Botryotinia calthae TaxID=38488 RepID=A0A4Y8DH78_9HELO|nr:hypothetical protein BOTCAL_0005g00640 [Botryotinia calthae]
MSISISIFSRSLWLLMFLGLGFMNVVQVRGHFGAVRVENEGNLLSPRYYMGLSEGRLLERGSGICESGFHSSGSSGCAVTISSSSTPALVSIVPSGCTTNQFACASSMGGGCCDDGFGCTVLSGTNYCAATTGTGSAIRTGSNGILATGSSDANSTSSNHGLSTGAKAGIGVAVALLVLACVGACIYFFTIHRRRALHSNSSSHPDMDIPPAAMSQLSGSRISRKSESKAGSKISKRPGVGLFWDDDGAQWTVYGECGDESRAGESCRSSGYAAESE